MLNLFFARQSIQLLHFSNTEIKWIFQKMLTARKILSLPTWFELPAHLSLKRKFEYLSRGKMCKKEDSGKGDFILCLSTYYPVAWHSYRSLRYGRLTGNSWCERSKIFEESGVMQNYMFLPGRGCLQIKGLGSKQFLSAHPGRTFPVVCTMQFSFS